MEYCLIVNKLSKKYGHFQALEDLELKVPRGAIYGLVGRNGAVKSTFMRLLCGLQKPDSGEYSLFGVKNTNKEIQKIRHRMGAIIETPALYADMTAEENLQHQSRILGLPDNADNIKDLLELVGLLGLQNKKVRNFSLGMRQRLGIAVALCGNPDFLVLDEPTNGLDPQGIIEMRELIINMNQKYHITILLSSHILDEVSRMATHYGFIERGHLVKEMSSDELERICKKYIKISVNNIQALSTWLDEKAIKYDIVSDSEARVYASPNVTELVLGLQQKKCEVISLSENEETLESFYLRLLGGEQ